MATCNVQSLIADASCFTCVPGGYYYPLKLALLARWLKVLNPAADVSVQGLLRNASCFTCVPPGLWGPLKLALLCRIMQGGGGTPCVNPAAPGLVSFAIPGEDFSFWTWTEATDPKLDFLIQFGKTAGGPYPCTISVSASQRDYNTELNGVCALMFGSGDTVYSVIQARDSFTCASANSNEKSAIMP